MEKPIIRYLPNVQLFTMDEYFITDAKAREIWDDLSGDWTQGAHQEMSKRVMKEGKMTEGKVRILANGIASIAEVKDISFEYVLDDLVDIGTLDESDRDDVIDYMESR